MRYYTVIKSSFAGKWFFAEWDFGGICFAFSSLQKPCVAYAAYMIIVYSISCTNYHRSHRYFSSIPMTIQIYIKDYRNRFVISSVV